MDHQHDEELTPGDFAAAELGEETQFGLWPEVFGVALVAFVIAVMFAFAQGN